MKKLIYICFCLLAIQACKKEESLEPDETATPLVQQDPNDPNVGGGNNGGGNGGNGGGSGGGSASEFFNYTLNGTAVNSNDPTYNANLGSILIVSTGSVTATSDFVQIGFFTPPSSNDTIPLGGFSSSVQYIENGSDLYYPYNGQLIISEASSSLIAGTFYFNATTDPPSDTVVITSGSFSVNK